MIGDIIALGVGYKVDLDIVRGWIAQTLGTRGDRDNRIRRRVVSALSQRAESSEKQKT